MLYINNNTIKLTRGDTAYLPVSITLDDEEYMLKSDDTLTLTIKKYVNDDSFVLQKIINGENTFHIEPSDTSSLSFGLYKYDIQLNRANGDTHTIIDVSDFEILQEVTC